MEAYSPDLCAEPLHSLTTIRREVLLPSLLKPNTANHLGVSSPAKVSIWFLHSSPTLI